jgi:hypothetical protein
LNITPETQNVVTQKLKVSSNTQQDANSKETVSIFLILHDISVFKNGIYNCAATPLNCLAHSELA